MCTSLQGSINTSTTLKGLRSAAVLKSQETAKQGARGVTYLQLTAEEAWDLRVLLNSSAEGFFPPHKGTTVQAELTALWAGPSPAWLLAAYSPALATAGARAAFSASQETYPSSGLLNPLPSLPSRTTLSPHHSQKPLLFLSQATYTTYLGQLPASYDPQLPSYFSAGSLLKRKHNL